MYRLLFALFCLFSSNFSFQSNQSQARYDINTNKLLGDPCVDCACGPDFAGPDQFLCKQTPALSVQIGCAMDPANPECSDLCFLWDPAPGLNPADNMKSNPTVNPTVTTTYTVKVKNTKNPTPSPCGGTISYEVTVYVFEMELVLYKPKVIAGNTTTPADPANGAQTFVNLDNDDNDIYYDNAKFEQSTGGIAGGDDELIRAELRLLPVDLPDNLVKLVATQGATDIKIWTDESKAGSEYLLGTDVALSLDGGYLKKNLWIEGISAHTVQQGTKLKMTYKGNDCGTNVNITVLGVENITWVGNGNSVSNNNSLDSDPNYLPPNPVPATWPSGVRVFPDARAPNYTVPLNTVQLEVTLSVAPVEPVDLYVRSFDVDDPTNNIPAGLSDPNYLAFVDPNDSPGTPVSGFYPGTGNAVTFTNHEDNRTNNTKSGVFAGQIGNSAPISFSTLASATIIFPNISMHPGDNYRAVVNGDKDFLENLENLDARDEYKIVDRFATQMGALPYEIISPMKYASPVLTIWRFLHVISESMSQFASDVDYTLGRVFADYFSPTSTSNNIITLLNANTSLRFGIDPIPGGEVPDLSPVIGSPAPPCAGIGRFSGGEVKVAGQAPFASILSNDITNVNLASNLNLNNINCVFTITIGGVLYTGTADLIIIQRISAAEYIWRLTNIVLPVGRVLTDFIGGNFRIITSPTVGITNANIINSTITTNGFRLRTVLFDDDARISSSLLPQYPSLTSMSVYNEAYIEPIGSNGSNAISADSNLGDDANDVDQIIAEIGSNIQESPSYWVAYVLTAWQHHTWRDRDQNLQTSNGSGDACQLTGFYEAPALLGNTTDDLSLGVHFNSNTDVVAGFNYSHIYTEVLREVHLPSSITIAHEIGHQFGLGHGNNDAFGGMIPECGDPLGNCLPSTMKLMAPNPITPADLHLIPRYQNLIRSRTNSPGY
ncbi:MAG: hypothetical protein JNN28_21590 [Saprospiraceae bacterium]|nr:hypothetical protein [Saprospiraceae bacterium]